MYKQIQSLIIIVVIIIIIIIVTSNGLGNLYIGSVQFSLPQFFWKWIFNVSQILSLSKLWIILSPAGTGFHVVNNDRIWYVFGKLGCYVQFQYKFSDFKFLQNFSKIYWI